ncbi:MAG: hypothetical protein CVU57_26055 [Deltaproteobacteria bacterium HGW-Deltaproteobacteria-15]|nr:MAG: hypothetical protein CVU57_26055 [Deltaproteobacteria bacterium HGW-Deltaproteobacteria-15]
MGIVVECFTFIGERNAWIMLMAIPLLCRYLKPQLATRRLLKISISHPIRGGNRQRGKGTACP